MTQYKAEICYMTELFVNNDKNQGCDPDTTSDHGMIDAMENGFDFWNWGGTWISQEGVYRFKKRWGTVDKEYYYFTDIHDKNILRWDKEKILKEFPNFYTVPFNNLENE